MATTTRYNAEHWPTLETLLMIERAVKEADMPPKITELWKALP